MPVYTTFDRDSSLLPQITTSQSYPPSNVPLGHKASDVFPYCSGEVAIFWKQRSIVRGSRYAREEDRCDIKYGTEGNGHAWNFAVALNTTRLPPFVVELPVSLESVTEKKRERTKDQKSCYPF